MNVLILMDFIGNGAGGVVNNNILKCFDLVHVNYEVICIQNTKPNARIHEIGLKFNLNDKLRKLLFIIFRRDFKFPFFINKLNEKFLELSKVKDFDLVFCVTTGGLYHTLEGSNYLYKKYKLPYFVHCLDPLPTPEHWGDMKIYLSAIKKFAQQIFKFSKGFSSTNEKMLVYQSEQFEFTIPSYLLYNPINEFTTHSKMPSVVESSFLFLGSFYGQRKADSLINAFEIISKHNKNANLSLVGNSNLFEFEDKIKKLKISVKEFTNQPELEILKHQILIDIDANNIKDVFLSSKFSYYLTTSKIILVITSENSPSYELINKFKLKTIIVSSHSPEEIAKKMNECIELSKSLSGFDIMEDRKNIIAELSIEKQASRIKIILDNISN